MYMGGIHAGIQSLHATSAMWRKYDEIYNPESPYYSMMQTLRAWEDDHKTVVLLNGGDHAALLNLESFLNSHDNFYPWASFRESQDALNGALTAIVVLIPAKLYKRGIKKKPKAWTNWEWVFYQWREKCSLAH